MRNDLPDLEGAMMSVNWLRNVSWQSWIVLVGYSRLILSVFWHIVCSSLHRSHSPSVVWWYPALLRLDWAYFLFFSSIVCCCTDISPYSVLDSEQCCINVGDVGVVFDNPGATLSPPNVWTIFHLLGRNEVGRQSRPYLLWLSRHPRCPKWKKENHATLQEITLVYTIHTLDLDLSCAEWGEGEFLTILALEFIARTGEYDVNRGVLVFAKISTGYIS